ncbi:MAG: type II CAAX endopeptidase family protein [Planctomycetota bacterium]
MQEPQDAAPHPDTPAGSSPEVAEPLAAPLTPALPVEPVPKFCARCGVKWDPAWQTCPSCLPPSTVDSIAGGIRVHQATRRIEPDADPNAPGLAASLWLYFLFLATSLFAMFAYAGELTVRQVLAIQALDTLIVLAFAVVFFTVLIGPLRRLSLGYTALAALIGIPSMAFAWVFVSALHNLVGFESAYETQGYFDAGYGWAVVMISFVIQPAVVEEVMFRGLILPGLQRFMKTRDAVIVSSALFSVIHLTVAIPQFLMGLVAGWLRVKSGSLWPCIVFHAVHNGLVVGVEGWLM